ncbi:MAG TPA: sigma-70 family RNA polymerase sigma factor [Roseiflexaceae bacterium]|nr:sigma-70 family RNA polymerase sigma factor [Roseiflexaceae bacterium]HMP42104.1 sigma-70 family RNA polymerase sigma factor [Roseiflexaceae bacterium]
MIERARALEAEALNELYRRYADAVFRYIFYRINDTAAAEDLTGDVFVKAIEGLPSYQVTGKPFEAWLYSIAHARVIDYYRRQQVRRTTPLNEALAAGDGTNPDTLVVQRDDVRRVQAALKQITEEQQQVVLLRFINGHSLLEVAEILGRSEGAIKALQHRALAALRRVLEHKDG